MINSKACVAGSECPPPQEGTLRLYGNRFCPYVKRVLLVLKYLKVPHEVVNINFKSKPEWFLKKTPIGSVPVLEVEGNMVFESLICGRLIDQVYGGGRLHGSEPFKEAEQCMWIERVAKVNALFFSCLKNKDMVHEKVQAADATFKDLESECTGGYFGGLAPNFLDLMAYPFFERFSISKCIMGSEFFDSSKYPNLARWRGMMADQKFVKDSFEDQKLQTEFIKQFIEPKCAMPDTDIGL